MKLFQSTHPRGVRLLANDLLTSDVQFQSTHPRGVRPKRTRSKSPSGIFQSTHPRGVRLSARYFVSFSICISIHAPARGATRAPAKRQKIRQISIHAPARGATLQLNSPTSCRQNFNPRTREGCDGVNLLGFYAHKNFNPRTREGCDVFDGFNCPVQVSFQSTHPRGVRHEIDSFMDCRA